MKNTHGLRRIGAAAADLCYLACGRVRHFEYNLNAWDVATWSFNSKKVGGIVNDFTKSNNWLFGKENSSNKQPSSKYNGRNDQNFK